MTDDPEGTASPSATSRARRSGISQPAPAPEKPPADDAAPASKAGRNLPAAIGVGLGLGAIIVASLFVYRPSFAVIVGIAVSYGCYELCRAIATTEAKPALIPLLVGGVASLVAAWERGPNGLTLAVMLTACAVVLWRIADGAAGYLRDVGASLLVLLYVPTLAAFAVMLCHPHDGAARILAFIATVVCSDTRRHASGVGVRHPPPRPAGSQA